MPSILPCTPTFPSSLRASLLRQQVVVYPDGSEECWRDVSDYVGYYRGSSWGRVRSLTRWVRHSDGHIRVQPGRLLHLTPSGDGYLHVHLHKDGVAHCRGVHRLVLEAFVGPCPPGLECRHLNGKPADNRLENLAWGTDGENQADRITHGTDDRGERQWKASLRDADVPDIHEEYAAGESRTAIARRRGVSNRVIEDVLNGQTYRNSQPAVPAANRPPERAGEANGNARLTEADVLEIRRLWATGQYTKAALARRYGVGRKAISDVVERRKWKHI
jgi:hypothetical protein